MKYYGFKSVAKFPRSNLKNLGFAANGMAQVIKALFANNEQGFAFDFNDLSTMYQDSAGTIPVTGVGQPVGLVLDKSKGLVLGNERWIDANTVIVGRSQILGGGKYRIYSPDGAMSYIAVSRGLEPNKMYEAVFTIESISGPIALVGSPDVTFTTTGKKRCVFTPLNSTLAIKRATTCDAVISSVSVRELPGNHATQSTSAKRPMLQKNATTGAYYLAFDGVDDLLSTASFPAMGLGTTIFSGSLCSKTSTSVIAARGAAGYLYQTNSLIAVQNSTTTTVAASGKTVATAIYSDNGNDVTIRANKLTNTQPNTARGYNNTAALNIGSLTPTGAALYQGDIYSVIGINRVATATEITDTENAIAKNVGVTL